MLVEFHVLGQTPLLCFVSSGLSIVRSPKSILALAQMGHTERDGTNNFNHNDIM